MMQIISNTHLIRKYRYSNDYRIIELGFDFINNIIDDFRFTHIEIAQSFALKVASTQVIAKVDEVSKLYCLDPKGISP